MQKHSSKIIVIVFLLVADMVYAQPPGPPGGGSDVDDVLPINILVYPFLLLGAYLGFKFFKKPSK